jgi:signal transduction histidine kinase
MICRRLAELHGGTLTIRSQPGEGATVTVRLPAGPEIDRMNHHGSRA